MTTTPGALVGAAGGAVGFLTVQRDHYGRREAKRPPRGGTESPALPVVIDIEPNGRVVAAVHGVAGATARAEG